MTPQYRLHRTPPSPIRSRIGYCAVEDIGRATCNSTPAKQVSYLMRPNGPCPPVSITGSTSRAASAALLGALPGKTVRAYKCITSTSTDRLIPGHLRLYVKSTWCRNLVWSNTLFVSGMLRKPLQCQKCVNVGTMVGSINRMTSPWRSRLRLSAIWILR